MLCVAKYLKHKMLISLIYGCGLRCFEVRNVRLRDLDFDRKVLHFVQGKGKKDRYLLLRNAHYSAWICTYQAFWFFEFDFKKTTIPSIREQMGMIENFCKKNEKICKIIEIDDKIRDKKKSKILIF